MYTAWAQVSELVQTPGQELFIENKHPGFYTDKYSM